MFKFKHSDVPTGLTVIDFVKQNVPWTEAVSDIGHRFAPALEAPLEFDAEALLKEVYEVYLTLNATSWRSQDSINMYGLSVTYNPSMNKDEWAVGSFGHPRYKKHSKSSYYEAVSADLKNRTKDDYLDSLGFRMVHPEIAWRPEFHKLLSQIAPSITRSTLRTINGILVRPSATTQGGFHVDDSPFEVLRLNISLNNDGNFGLEYEGHPPIIFRTGQALVVNTDVRHRAYVANNTSFQRTNLIVGVSPWLDYDSAADEWTLNKYFGQVHPYDIPLVKRDVPNH
jgi:hypothetical protein